MQRSTILHTLPDFRLGGGQVLLLRLIQQLSSHHEHVVVGFDDGDLRDDFEDSCIAVEVVGPSRIAAVRKTSDIVRRHSIDLIHTNNTPLDRLCGQTAGLINRRPVVNTFHSLPTLHDGSKGQARRYVNRLTTRVGLTHSIAVSHHVGSLYQAALGLGADEITVIHPGIAVGEFAAAVEPASGLEPNPPGAVRFVSVGRLTPPKNMATVIEAMGAVRSSMPGAQLLIVGDGPEREPLTRLIDDLGLDDAVRLLGQRNDVANVLNQSDIFVTATELEGFGMAPVEAMACGLPVVAANIPVFREFLDDSVGRIVPASRLASAMIELAEDPTTRSTCVLAARHRAAQFSIERYATAVAEVYASFSRPSRDRSR